MAGSSVDACIRQAGKCLAAFRVDRGEVDFAGLEGEFRGLLFGDRLADDLLEMRLDRALVVRVDFEHEVLARLPFLQDIGAAADQRRGDVLLPRASKAFLEMMRPEPSASAIV